MPRGAADDAIGLAPGRYLTAPTRHSQIDLMHHAMDRAGLGADEIDYIEAHATGTQVGDRIEGNAISETFRSDSRVEPLRISSVKSNIGHLEAAAFGSSLMKVIMMMRHRTFAPISKNYRTLNPEIDFDPRCMHVQTEVEPFPSRPVTIGINSFGLGGAGGHCLVGEYRPHEKRQ